MQRRHFRQATLAMSAAVMGRARWCSAAEAATAVEQAHAEIWRRFVDRHGILLDFTDLNGQVELPTPEECRQGRPNALGWWSPIENGAMFNGMYMDAAVLRWQRSQTESDATKARRLMEGLLTLNSISERTGFVGRGVSTDGRSHYPMGSNDQTLPWFYGLWRYLEAGPVTAAERERIVARLVETAEVIVGLNWAIPAEPPFGVRGSFAGFEFDSAPRLLFVCRLLYELTQAAKWDELYHRSLSERGGPEKLSRQVICERGMVFHYAKYHSWTSCSCVAVLRSLWELEQDATIKAAYARGLQASVDLAVKSLPLALQFDHDDATTFDANWRMMNELWQPQQTETEAQDLAHRQLRAFLKVSPRRARETEFVREPTAAAWVVSLAPDAALLKSRTTEIERVIAHYDYTRLYYSQFFWVECAWERLQQVQTLSANVRS